MKINNYLWQKLFTTNIMVREKKRLCLVRGEKVEEREVGNEERKEEKQSGN